MTTKIFLKDYNREHPDYIATFAPKEDGEVSIEVLKKVWKLETDEQVFEILNEPNQHPDFYVVHPTPDNGDSAVKNNGKLSSK